MATSKPRVTVTLEPDVYSTMKELAELQGRSLSSLIGELVNMVHPVQLRVLSAVKAAVTTQQEARADLLHQLESAQEEAESKIVPLLDLLDAYAQGLPPHSNTGVTHPTPLGQTPSKNDLKPSE